MKEKEGGEAFLENQKKERRRLHSADQTKRPRGFTSIAREEIGNNEEEGKTKRPKKGALSLP